jgi:hypothetical protein
MVTKELIKSEIDKVQDEYLGVLYKIIKSLEEPSEAKDNRESWSQFVEATYGSFAGAPIERGEQGGYEARVPFE